MAPNMPKPTTKLTAPATLKIRLRNSPSGSTGSAARRSAATNATSSSTAAAPSATICQERHG